MSARCDDKAWPESPVSDQVFTCSGATGWNGGGAAKPEVWPTYDASQKSVNYKL